MTRRRLKQVKAAFDRIWALIWAPGMRPTMTPPKYISMRGLNMTPERRANLLLLDQEQHGFLHSGMRT